MKVLHLSTYDVRGGAARAAFRVHTAIGTAMDSYMSVNTKESSDPRVSFPSSAITRLMAKVKMQFNYEPARMLRGGQVMFSNGLFNTSQKEEMDRLNPDIINLHWINEGLVSINALDRFEKPVVWTVHDMWTFTGGCHYTEGCEAYKTGCGHCPQLKSKRSADLSRFVMNRKRKVQKKITFVAPSVWMKNCLDQSASFGGSDVHVIPYPIDLRVFSPRNKSVAREILGLPVDKKLVLFGAMNAQDERKGLRFLEQALLRLGNDQNFNRENIELVIFGSSSEQRELSRVFKIHYLGKLTDEISLALSYNACDVFVAPSTQDNLPNTVIESLACGVPVVAFNIGGMPDMITHQRTGYLASDKSGEDLANGLHYILTADSLNIGRQCRDDAVARYSQHIIASSYRTLYESILSVESHGRLNSRSRP